MMTVFERIEELRKSKKISQGKLEKELGFSNGSISKWKTSMPNSERLQKLADYFGVTSEYLMTGKEPDKKQTELSARDEKDIKKDLDSIMSKIRNGEDGPLRYNGDVIDEESIELFENAMELALKTLKTVNKEKYNPNKNKK